MGEKQNQPFQLSFNTSLKVDIQGSRVTLDGALIVVRKSDERLGLGELIQQQLTDPRRGKNTHFRLANLFRQSVYSRLTGYEDLNDAKRLSQDPTFRLTGWEKILERVAALTSRLQSLEIEILAEQENSTGFARINRELIGKAEAVASLQRVVLDMDSTGIPVYGRQEQSACNGRFESTCYQPLLLFNREGDCVAAKLRPGNAHSAGGWKEMLLPKIERRQKQGEQVEFHVGELFPRVGFIVTNLEADSRAVVRSYNKRGTAEQWMKEGKQAVKMTRSSSSGFRASEARLWLSVIAYNPGEPLAPAHFPAAPRQLVAHPPATTIGEDRRPAGAARALLLAVAGRVT